MKTKIKNGREYIFDIVRKKYVRNQPEEWVRQHMISYLSDKKGYPPSLMSVEKKNEINSINKRCDIICYNKEGTPLILIECKARKIKINEKTFEQSLIYNQTIQAKYILITNGLDHYCFQIQSDRFFFTESIPSFQDVK